MLNYLMARRIDGYKEVCLSENNILLKACPGSGKTRTLTYKLAYTSLKYDFSKKTNVAITFTNRAADEIKKRIIDLDIKSNNIWAGTIHQFCLEHIIRPYSMFHKSLKKGYKIIDEYISKKYIDEIINQLGMEKIVGYNDPFDYDNVKTEYINRLLINREIDFDMILDKSIDLLSENTFIRKNISETIRSIFVDEYQDTNERQYLILKHIYQEQSSIQLFFVGDTDQAIYGTIGGIAKDKTTLEELYNTEFDFKSLSGCYRSSQKIIDYYRAFQIDSSEICSESSISNSDCKIVYDNFTHKDSLIEYITNIIMEELESGIEESEICILAP